MEQLFRDLDGKTYGAEDIFQNLKRVEADDCETLFIHSDVMFGSPVEGFTKKKYLSVLYEVIQDLGVKNIVVPTFTYSFCNNEIYDVVKSKTLMGAFNEYVRKAPDRYRTMDPLLSLSVPNHLIEFFKQYNGRHSLGEKSGLDAIHHMDGVKFLFLGADMGSCFTYIHYVEKKLDVPYRFDMRFQGKVVDEKGNVSEREQYIHTQCYGVKLPKRYGYFEDELVNQGIAKKVRMGDKYILCMKEKDAYKQIENRIYNNINYFLEKPFTKADLIHKYTYNLSNGKITHC